MIEPIGSRMSPSSLPDTPSFCDLEAVLGVDTHRDTHSAAVVSALGALLDTRTFPATADGYHAILDWARQYGLVKRAGWSAPDRTEQR